MPAASLVSMAQRSALRNLGRIEDVADIPYELIRPVLRKIDNPMQLRTIEKNSPHIAANNADLWKAFIARDIPDWKSKMVHPKNPASWWKVYNKLMREENDAREAQEKALEAALKGIDKQKDETKTHFLQKVIPQKAGTKVFVDGLLNREARKPTLQNAKTGKDIMSAIRRESVQASAQRSTKVMQPARTMAVPGKGQISAAPPSMLREYAPRPTPKQPPAAVTPHQNKSSVFGRGDDRPRATDAAINAALRAEKAEQVRREDRLRAIAGNGPKSSPMPNAERVRVVPKKLDVVSTATQPPDAAWAPTNLKRQRSPSPAPVTRKKPAGSVFMPRKKK